MHTHVRYMLIHVCTGLAVAVAYGGGENIRDQMRMVERGADIIVAAPGRLVDFMERGKVLVARHDWFYLHFNKVRHPR
jgi:superfamily II DNA/RNA helicase